jgi:hypothetical protein
MLDLEFPQFQSLIYDMTRHELEVAYIDLTVYYANYRTVVGKIFNYSLDDLAIEANTCTSRARVIMLSEEQLFSLLESLFLSIQCLNVEASILMENAI